MAAMPHYKRNTIETAKMSIAARDHLFAWAAQEGIDFDLKQQGILHIYRDKAGFDHAGKVSQLLAQGGLSRQAVTPQEMLAIEPTLAGHYYGGYYTASDSTGDIHKFTTGLATAAERLGVRCLYDQEVTALKAHNNQVLVTVNEATGPSTSVFDGLVVCAGTASRQFAAMLGDRVNVYPVKGYSITVNLNDAQSQAAAPHVSLLDDETKLVSSRLGLDRFRVAGTAEFNGFNRDIRADRIKPLVDWVAECFPGVRTENVVPWAGLRPMLPNMMPKVGRGHAPGVFYNTGHGHLGWTLSALTADMVADLLAQSAKAPSSLPLMSKAAA
jgi:D-amino-acid dehydrogenase